MCVCYVCVYVKCGLKSLLAVWCVHDELCAWLHECDSNHPTLSLSLSLNWGVRQVLHRYLLLAEISSEKPDLVILKCGLKVKHIDLVSSLQQTFSQVAS